MQIGIKRSNNNSLPRQQQYNKKSRERERESVIGKGDYYYGEKISHPLSRVQFSRKSAAVNVIKRERQKQKRKGQSESSERDTQSELLPAHWEIIIILTLYK